MPSMLLLGQPNFVSTSAGRPPRSHYLAKSLAARFKRTQKCFRNVFDRAVSCESREASEGRIAPSPPVRPNPTVTCEMLRSRMELSGTLHDLRAAFRRTQLTPCSGSSAPPPEPCSLAGLVLGERPFSDVHGHTVVGFRHTRSHGHTVVGHAPGLAPACARSCPLCRPQCQFSPQPSSIHSSLPSGLPHCASNVTAVPS